MEVFLDKDEGADADHVRRGQIVVMFGGIFAVDGLLNEVSPPHGDVLVVANQHVIGAELDHLLETDHNQVNIVFVEPEKFVGLLLVDEEAVRVDIVAVPG